MFNTLESSTQDANGVDLYQFRCGPNTWEYTAGEEPQAWRGKTYVPLAISNNGVRQSGDASNNETMITLPKSTVICQMLVEDIPSVPVNVIVRRKHFGSTDAPIFVIAELASFNRAEADMMELSFQMMSATFKRTGARMAWSRQCQHALYDQGCKVDRTLYDALITVQAVGNGRIGSNDIGIYPKGYFDNGFIEWVNSYGITQRRAIEKNSGTEMTLLGRIDMISLGMVVTAYPGCARTTRICNDKFDNIPNYGGVNFLPGKSPFQGDPIW
jgi:uncharacterized phage protein (TIGR02218 family)